MMTWIDATTRRVAQSAYALVEESFRSAGLDTYEDCSVHRGTLEAASRNALAPHKAPQPGAPILAQNAMGGFARFLHRLPRGPAKDPAVVAQLHTWFNSSQIKAPDTATMLRTVHSLRPALFWTAHAAVPWARQLGDWDAAQCADHVDLLLEHVGDTQAWQHLDLAALLRAPAAGPFILALCRVVGPSVGGGALRSMPEQPRVGPLWGALADVSRGVRCLPRDASLRRALALCLPALMQHPHPQQRRVLLRRLFGDTSRVELRLHLLPAVDAYSRGEITRGTLILQLGLIAWDCGALLQEPRVQRLLGHRAVCRDGRKIQQWVADVLSLSGLPAAQRAPLLRRILLQPDAATLSQSPLRALHQRAVAAGQDVLTAGVAKRAVNAYYAQQVLPAVLASLHAHASLALGCPTSPLLAAEKLVPVARLQDDLRAALVTPGRADGRVAHMLAGWRAPHLLYTYAGRLTQAEPQGLSLLRAAVAAAADGTYHAWRRRGSAQLRAVLQGAADFDLPGWEAGEAGPVEGRPGWTVEDTASLQDFINSASEGAHSCLAVDYDVHYSRCLVGRLADGAKRMVVVKNAAGAIVARAMLRLMQDATQRPALLLSRPYDSIALPSAAAKDLLLTWAQRRAAALGIELLHAAADIYPRHGGPVRLMAEPSLALDYWDEGVEPWVRDRIMVCGAHGVKSCTS